MENDAWLVIRRNAIQSPRVIFVHHQKRLYDIHTQKVLVETNSRTHFFCIEYVRKLVAFGSSIVQRSNDRGLWHWPNELVQSVPHEQIYVFTFFVKQTKCELNHQTNND